MGLLDAVKEYIGFRRQITPSHKAAKTSLSQFVECSVHELQCRIDGLVNAQFVIENVLGEFKILLDAPYIGNTMTQQTDTMHRISVWWRNGDNDDNISMISVGFNSKNLYNITFLTKSATRTNAMHNAHMVSKDMPFEEVCQVKIPSWFKEIIEGILESHNKE